MAEPPAAKRVRSGDAPPAPVVVLPELGHEVSEWIESRGLGLRHGTSMRLMADVTTYLNSTRDFNEVDPNEDWEKWTTRRPGMSLYFAAITDVTEASSARRIK